MINSFQYIQWKRHIYNLVVGLNAMNLFFFSNILNFLEQFQLIEDVPFKQQQNAITKMNHLTEFLNHSIVKFLRIAACRAIHCMALCMRMVYISLSIVLQRARIC